MWYFCLNLILDKSEFTYELIERPLGSGLGEFITGWQHILPILEGLFNE
jgi:hypothetical protein